MAATKTRPAEPATKRATPRGKQAKEFAESLEASKNGDRDARDVAHIGVTLPKSLETTAWIRYKRIDPAPGETEPKWCYGYELRGPVQKIGGVIVPPSKATKTYENFATMVFAAVTKLIDVARQATDAEFGQQVGDAIGAWYNQYGGAFGQPEKPADETNAAPAAKPAPPSATKSAQRETPATESETIKLPLKLLVRHPDNRVPDPAAVEARAASFVEHGQLEDVIVRRIDHGKYEILSGETRVLAALKLKWVDIKCRIRECNDAQALELLAEYNAQRDDLNPIEKARLIKRMCDPIEQGGSGLTREAAAKKFRMESHAAASNLVRLLELPEVWQQRVIVGELPQTFARLLVPYVGFPTIMKELDQSFKDDVDYQNPWLKREWLEDHIQDIIHECTRPVDKSVKQHYSVPGNWQASGNYACLLDTSDPELREKLDVRTIEIREEGKKGKTTTREIEVALNVKLFDKLQHAAILKAYEAGEKRKAQRAGDKADAGAKKAKTKAEIEHDKRVRAAQLESAIGEWCIRMLRRAISGELQRQEETGGPIHPATMRLLLTLALEPNVWPGWRCMPSSYLEALGIAADERTTFAQLSGVGDVHKRESFDSLARRLLALLLVGGPEPPDGKGEWLRPAEFDDALIEDVFAEYDLDFADVWRGMQLPAKPHFEEFFQLHRKDELAALGREFEIHLDDKLSKGQMVKLLTTRDRALPLPNCLQPAKPAAPAKKGGRR